VVIVLTVDRYESAMRVIQQFETMSVISERVLLLKLKDEPGALAQIERRFTQAGIGMHSIRII